MSSPPPATIVERSQPVVPGGWVQRAPPGTGAQCRPATTPGPVAITVRSSGELKVTLSSTPAVSKKSTYTIPSPVSSIATVPAAAGAASARNVSAAAVHARLSITGTVRPAARRGQCG